MDYQLITAMQKRLIANTCHAVGYRRYFQRFAPRKSSVANT
jgi:hypothetical protein